MNLQSLLKGLSDVIPDLAVQGLAIDSRKVLPGYAFIVLPVEQQNTALYINNAIAQGAVAIVYDQQDATIAALAQESDLAFIAISQLAENLGKIAARYYGEPANSMDIIGITGTNGKTSCSQFLGQLLDNCGIVGTLGWGVWGDLTYTGYTTPDALSTQAILSELLKQGRSAVAMEVSSHGIAEGRINSIPFKGVVLTNISRDHLDYHGTMDAYVATKKRLFTNPATGFAVVNGNDALCAEFLAIIPPAVKTWVYQVKAAASQANSDGLLAEAGHVVYARDIRQQAEGLSFDVVYQSESVRIAVPIYGSFNVENVLAVITVMLALGHPLPVIAKKVNGIQAVAGRMQRLGDADSALIFVDYAHTPDALAKALASAREHCARHLWVVFGCGGDRDNGKRPQMAAIAEAAADFVIITDDNPRTESPEAIVTDMLAGLTVAAESTASRIKVIHDRKQAIEYAIAQASTQDCVLIAGKGHELYQEYQQQKFPFSDVVVVNNYLSQTGVLPCN